MTTDLVNTDEHCRACKGTGGDHDIDYNGARSYTSCFFCRGTGCQTVRIDPAPCGTPRNHGEEIANARAGR
ncbi:MAG: hypothetical protein JXQ91_07560 [Vannielia sp.]|uniref:hypothetical protein n=1 Tax=Vannielia sp. TaxID=2813045 RepID=UPI003B8E2C64